MRNRVAWAVIGGFLIAFSPVPARAETPAEEATRLAGEGRFSEAAQRFEEAVRREPKNASLHLGLGLAYQSLQRFPEAVQALEKAARLEPGSAEPVYSLGLLYEAAAADPSILREPDTEALRRRFFQKARQAWDKVVRLSKDPKRVEVAKEHLGRILEALR